MASISVPVGGVPSQSAPRPRLRVSDYLRWSVDHKIIGVQYMVTSFFFFLVGGTLAMLIRWELLTPNLDVVQNGSQYNSLFSVHALVMIFLWIIPMFAGFGNYFVPLMLGAKDMAFPWLNAFAFWMLPPAGILMLASMLVGAPEAVAGQHLVRPAGEVAIGEVEQLDALAQLLLAQEQQPGWRFYVSHVDSFSAKCYVLWGRNDII